MILLRIKFFRSENILGQYETHFQKQKKQIDVTFQSHPKVSHLEI